MSEETFITGGLQLSPQPSMVAVRMLNRGLASVGPWEVKLPEDNPRYFEVTITELTGEDTPRTLYKTAQYLFDRGYRLSGEVSCQSGDSRWMVGVLNDHVYIRDGFTAFGPPRTYDPDWTPS